LDCNLQARKDYQPQVYSGQATLFWSNCQSQYIDLHPQLGWDELILEGIETCHLPGDRSSLMKEPHVQVLAQKLQCCIDRAANNSELSLSLN
jgi:thioesterase domain-containing protein